MLTNAQVDILLLHLIEVVSSATWSDWLGKVASAFGASVSAIVPVAVAAPGRLSVLAAGATPERQSAYQERFHRNDLWLQRMRAAPTGIPHTEEMLVSQREFLGSEIYNEFLRPAGVRHRAGVTIDVAGSRYLFALSRVARQGAFQQDELAALGRIAPFLHRALEVHRALFAAEASSRAAREVLNCTRGGIALLDQDLKVVFSNEAAMEFVSAGNVLALRGGQLTALNRADEIKFRASLDLALTTPGRQATLLLRGTKDEDQLTATVLGLPALADRPSFDLGFSSPAVLVVLSHRSLVSQVRPETLESVFGLTAQEARTASLLVAGLDLGAVASALSIGRETVRYHLKGLFAKTGTHSQRELVSFITGSLPQLPSPAE